LLPFELFKALVLAYRTPYLLEAYGRVWRQLPSALRKRRIVQGRRRVTGGEIQAMLTYPQRLKDWRQRLIERFRRLPA
ncbi:MAG: hypothetical protein K8I02_10525, partial [Candidatus Methylomirabilis sp.]|nr:hypothetical protein [Deltaproteobacteria bacterium]